ncbi:unnamed protein product [Clonostachys byssicola]|uniref:Uncharacterized protein n=1 Tax=Clonostachys byssicola TaxID=160290 RepID=A0A9N9Y920_9HYPO|nr:unnamed protein product [Clonostachys byssicola]
MNPFYSLWTQLRPLEYPSADCSGKTVLVTGANSGLGFEAACHFVRLGAKVILGCRDMERGAHAKAAIEMSVLQASEGVVEIWQVDLASFASVRAFCTRAAELDRLDIIVANAGIQLGHFHVAEGYERQVTVNAISTFLMAVLLLPVLKRSAAAHGSQARITIVGSNAQRWTSIRHDDTNPIFESMRGGQNMQMRYGVSKLLILLATRELADRIANKLDMQHLVTVNIAEPGLCKSQLFREAVFPTSWLMAVLVPLLGRTSEMGSRCLVHAATAGEDTHGKYLEDCGFGDEGSWVRSAKGAVAQKRVFDELLDIIEGISPGSSELLRE